MITVDEALEKLEQRVEPLEREVVALSDALHRVAAERVGSPIDLPPFPQSAMDGYAIRSADVEEASESNPVRLALTGEVAAGATGSLPEVGRGEAARVFTGGRVPPGADAIVRQERVSGSDGEIEVTRTVPAGKDLRPVGEELEQGEPLVEVGERLDERHLGALSMTGHPELEVHRHPKIALLVSGDEVVPATAELQPGQIYDANTPFLVGLLQRLGYRELEVQRVEDDEDAVARALDESLDEYDLVVSTGGVSVGDYDFLGQAAEDLGAQRVFWNVDQKPGRPVFFAVRDGTPFLGLPGNPGAVFVNAHAYLTRVLDGLEGAFDRRPHFRRGRLTGPIAQSSKRLRWSPCTVASGADGAVELTPIDGGRAHRMGRVFRADALVRVDPGEGELDTGEVVRWITAC